MTFRRTHPSITAAALLAALVCAGCDDEARDFAAKTRQILDQRSHQLSAKLAAEKAAYTSSAAHAAEDNRTLVALSLQNERNERSSALAADYDEGRKPVSLWRRDLAEYARIDYEANRTVLTSDINASSAYLQTFAELTIEQDKVNALSKLLAALSAQPSLKDDIAALGSFAGDTKTEFDKTVCTDLKTRSTGQDAADGKTARKAYDAQGCEDLLK